MVFFNERSPKCHLKERWSSNSAEKRLEETKGDTSVSALSAPERKTLSQLEQPPFWLETVQQLYVIKSQACYAHPICNVPVPIDE